MLVIPPWQSAVACEADAGVNAVFFSFNRSGTPTNYDHPVQFGRIEIVRIAAPGETATIRVRATAPPDSVVSTTDSIEGQMDVQVCN
jgi:hypothetical protein